MTSVSLCKNCSNSLWCYTWGEYRCSVKKRRIYEIMTKCNDYEKRGKDFKETRCHCDDCLKNESLWEIIEEEKE